MILCEPTDPVAERIEMIEPIDWNNTNLTTPAPMVTTPMYNWTVCGDNETENALNNYTWCVNMTTVVPPGPTREPPRPECESSRCDDAHTRLVLGRRNDQEDGWLRAEFADFAVWYSSMGYDDPDNGKRMMGRECHEVGRF